MKNKLVVIWLPVVKGTKDVFSCTSLEGAQKILKIRRREFIKSATWYDSEGVAHEALLRREKAPLKPSIFDRARAELKRLRK